MTPAPVMPAKIETCKCKSFTQKRDKPDKVPHIHITDTQNTHLPKQSLIIRFVYFFLMFSQVDVYSFFPRRHNAGQADASDTFCHCHSFTEKYFWFSTRKPGLAVCKQSVGFSLMFVYFGDAAIRQVIFNFLKHAAAAAA